MSNEKMRAEAFAACPDGIDWGAFWLGYKTSRAALYVELPSDPNEEFSDRASAVEACRSAIESTGVRIR